MKLHEILEDTQMDEGKIANIAVAGALALSVAGGAKYATDKAKEPQAAEQKADKKTGILDRRQEARDNGHLTRHDRRKVGAAVIYSKIKGQDKE